MDFKLSKEHEMARKMFREFAENELEPLAVEIDEEERFPWENVLPLSLLLTPLCAWAPSWLSAPKSRR